LSKAVKELAKLQDERDVREQEVKLAANREISHLKEAAMDLQRICGNEDEARRYFTLAERAEIGENEFNLNLPRYVDTFEGEPVIPLNTAMKSLDLAINKSSVAIDTLR
jgi:type I restriction enzyme M protein